jgi:hypothetical protein
MGSLIMNTFYKISKEDANKVGSFEYEIGYEFNPFCSEQVDETYLVSIDLVEQLKDNENIKKEIQNPKISGAAVTRVVIVKMALANAIGITTGANTIFTICCLCFSLF